MWKAFLNVSRQVENSASTEINLQKQKQNRKKCLICLKVIQGLKGRPIEIELPSCLQVCHQASVFLFSSHIPFSTAEEYSQELIAPHTSQDGWQHQIFSWKQMKPRINFEICNITGRIGKFVETIGSLITSLHISHRKGKSWEISICLIQASKIQPMQREKPQFSFFLSDFVYLLFAYNEPHSCSWALIQTQHIYSNALYVCPLAVGPDSVPHTHHFRIMVHLSPFKVARTVFLTVALWIPCVYNCKINEMSMILLKLLNIYNKTYT